MSSKKVIKKKITLEFCPLSDIKVRRQFRVGTAFVERRQKKEKHKKDYLLDEE